MFPSEEAIKGTKWQIGNIARLIEDKVHQIVN